ncbi:putative cell division control protein CDC3 [Mrakia frigida]|uniref:septin CDC3 n=1 Tax=Mrakia frigida TaxID=29902 RepID=UPI003FCBFB3B
MSDHQHNPDANPDSYSQHSTNERDDGSEPQQQNGNGDESYGQEDETPAPPPVVAAPAPPPSVATIAKKKLTGYVGFANLPNQVHRKSVRKGFTFTAMVVGESGLGKSTLINTLFATTIRPRKSHPSPGAEVGSTVSVESTSADIEENGVRLRLNVVDTPGFGDFVNNDDSWKPIVDNIEARFDAYLEQENRVNRVKLVDNRIHACIYFIQPTGHSLKPIDIEFMRRLHQKVNLIPVIAKSDTLTDDEIKAFKSRILSDIAFHQIQIFQAPLYDNEDEETIAENEEITSKIPFAIVGSDTLLTLPSGQTNVRGRAYPWGIVEVDNEDHCDFVKLRQMLIRTHMEELREHTNDVLYERYRSDKLLNMGVTQDHTVFKEINPAAKMAEERSLHEAKLSKMEAEMKMVFQQKVQEKEAKLKQSEEELYARHREMKDALEKQRLELEDKKRRVEQGRPLTPEKSSTNKKRFGLGK